MSLTITVHDHLTGHDEVMEVPNGDAFILFIQPNRKTVYSPGAGSFSMSTFGGKLSGAVIKTFERAT